MVTGLYSTAGFVDLDHKTPEQAATLILERLALNEGEPKDHYTALIEFVGQPADWDRVQFEILRAVKTHLGAAG
ncbi:MAG: hypothetical protein ACREWE_05480 [Gammaproteobacteria bacterium]